MQNVSNGIEACPMVVGLMSSRLWSSGLHGRRSRRLVFTADYCVRGESHPQTLTHLDTYCRRVCTSDISEADLGTFVRSFDCEVLFVNIRHWTSSLQSARDARFSSTSSSILRKFAVLVCLDGTEEDRTQPLLPTSVRWNPNGQLNNS